MRRLRLVVALAAFVALPAFASPYADLRHAHPAIDDAVAAMPDSGLHGTLDRISATLQHVSSLPPGGAGELTPSEQRRLLDALRSLQRQLRSGLPSLGVADRLVIAQAVDVVAMRRVVELHDGIAPPSPCPPDSQWGAECHGPVQLEMDRIAALLEASVRDGFAQWSLDHPTDRPVDVPPAPAAGISSTNFGEWLDSVLAGSASLTGVETIDDGSY